MNNKAEHLAGAWEEIGQRTPLHTGRFLSIELRHFIRNGGEPKDYEVLKAGDSAMVVPVTKSGDTFLIKEFRAPLGRYIWTFPTGLIDEDEVSEPLLTAVRELEEETALNATNGSYLGKFSVLSGVTDAQTHLFVALVDEDSTPVPATREGIVEVTRLPFKDALELVDKGEIETLHAITAIYTTARYLGYNFSAPPSNT